MPVAANSDTLCRALQEFIVGGLAPAARVVGVQRERHQQEKGRGTEDALKEFRHFMGHRICKFKEIRPDTGPPSETVASLARDSRSTWTVPGAGRPSMMLICESGTLGNSLSSQTSVGAGTNRPTYRRSLWRSRLINVMS